MAHTGRFAVRFIDTITRREAPKNEPLPANSYRCDDVKELVKHLLKPNVAHRRNVVHIDRPAYTAYLFSIGAVEGHFNEEARNIRRKIIIKHLEIALSAINEDVNEFYDQLKNL